MSLEKTGYYSLLINMNNRDLIENEYLLIDNEDQLFHYINSNLLDNERTRYNFITIITLLNKVFILSNIIKNNKKLLDKIINDINYIDLEFNTLIDMDNWKDEDYINMSGLIHYVNVKGFINHIYIPFSYNTNFWTNVDYQKTVVNDLINYINTSDTVISLKNEYISDVLLNALILLITI